MLKRFAFAAAIGLSLPAHAQGPEFAAQEVPTEPATPASPELTEIVLKTTMGDIVVALETERAPITAGNFLRYVDEDRFDGTVFYRVMKLDWDPQPNGLIQAGPQNDPERILDPIAHEPTNETGVLHTRGALSMARFEPGTATGDFSILLQEQKGMDADPDNADPELQAGYAAFGHVVSGMEVVEAIYASPIDPEKGEGWIKGQLLAEPVTILDAHRVDRPATP